MKTVGHIQTVETGIFSCIHKDEGKNFKNHQIELGQALIINLLSFRTDRRTVHSSIQDIINVFNIYLMKSLRSSVEQSCFIFLFSGRKASYLALTTEFPPDSAKQLTSSSVHSSRFTEITYIQLKCISGKFGIRSVTVKIE